jgi:hypothetical protein
MSFFNQITGGSLLSSERLMQAREFYAPFKKETSAQLAFGRWTQRVSVVSALDAARELAGLPDEELAALEAEFVRCPMRQQSPWVRHAVASGAALTVMACLGLSLEALASFGHTETQALQTTSVACLLAGLVSLGAALVSAFGTMHLALSYGTTGLYVGTLDEQHPWLDSAISLTRNQIAESHRQHTLSNRGCLRGADVVMMRGLVESQEALQRVRPACSLVRQLQTLPVAAEPMTHEPRLVQVGTARDLRSAAPARPFGIEEQRSVAN